MKYVSVPCKFSEFHPAYIENACTVKQLKDTLDKFEDDTPVIIFHESRKYPLWGKLNPASIGEEEVE